MLTRNIPRNNRHDGNSRKLYNFPYSLPLGGAGLSGSLSKDRAWVGEEMTTL
jgi:hypothetical protein